MSQNNQTPLFIPNAQPSSKRKRKVWPFIVAGAIVLWFVAEYIFGQNSSYGITKKVESLRQDSIALQADFRPVGKYSHFRDLNTEIDNLRALGNPLRYGDDSIRIFSNPQTAGIASYNIAKCDSILDEVLPLWRVKLMFVLREQLRSESTIVRCSKKYENYSSLEIYLLKYLSEDAITHDAIRYNGVFNNFGFKSIVYAASPNNPGVEYTFK